MKSREIHDEQEVQRINKIQRDLFDMAVNFFDGPPEKGVPERLGKIVAAAGIVKGDRVLDIGSGTGVLVPLIREYGPNKIFACDMAEAMLARLKEHYPYAETLLGDVRDLTLPDESIDVVFMNAVYPNIADKAGAFSNMGRVMKSGGRMVISHPMGKSFIDVLRKKATFPLDDFPSRDEGEAFLEPYGFGIETFVDEPELYILVGVKVFSDNRRNS
ncbi:MAG: class I SAM-dependent methyltransferase [Deltaproteobacteria bacterium]|nr:class I SAM-dependent methyltransferase [Deltaproteobacteria bacterium]